jgi:hypothetical protein
MGLVLKALAVVVGLMLIPLGGWLISALLFLYAFSGPISRALRSGRRTTPAPAVEAPRAPPPVRFKGYSGHPLRRVLGLVFVGLSVIALAKGGVFSPFVFGGVGLSLLLWGAPVRVGAFGSFQPVSESVVMHGSPFHWVGVGEVKLSTKQAGRALGGIDETLLVDLGGDGPSVFVVLKTTSLTLRGAEETLLARFGELARISAPLGAYILPLDSSASVEVLSRRAVKPVQLEARGWPSALSTLDYDLLALDAKRGGFVHAAGAYKSGPAGGEGRATLQPARQTLSRPSLLWEVFQELAKKVEWKKPDGYTTFLASMFATEGEVIGERVSEAGDAGDSEQVLVQSLGTPPVRMSRAQLRAIARIYS